MDTYVQVSTTVDKEEDAEKIARTVVEKRLAGCVQIFPVASIYRWQGEIETAREWRLCMKTREDLCEAIDKVISLLSSYSVPEVIVTPIVAGSDAYLAWLDGELLGK
ncbi:MAG: Divalent-cation tolerance protein CutA [Syntrophus sp. PtaU1.Bin208]|nr:MAG: Divalent-cation tolerance protein CutA [Syntrophus sp. PtaU1.Bin208]